MNSIIAMLVALVMPALIAVESSGNDKAIGDNGRGVGCLQIHPECIEDVNRIAGTRYTLADRLDREKSKEICSIYLTHYGKAYARTTGKAPTAETLARIWNGGPRGYAKSATIPYWRKVERTMAKGRK